MKLFCVLVASFAAACPVLGGVCYLSPGVAYFSPTTDMAGDAVAGFLAVGYAFGSGGSHELELELGDAAWDRQGSYVVDWQGNVFQGSSDNDATLLLMNYRYRLRFSERVRGYIETGLGAGWIDVSWKGSRVDSSPVQGSSSGTGVALAAGIGLEWRVREKIAIQLGTRVGTVAASTSDDLDDIRFTTVGFNYLAVRAGARLEF